MSGFLAARIQAWDIAAGVLLVLEAGGKVTDISGKPFDLLAQNALASNGLVHSQIHQTLWSGKDLKKNGRRPRVDKFLARSY